MVVAVADVVVVLLLFVVLWRLALLVNACRRLSCVVCFVQCNWFSLVVVRGFVGWCDWLVLVVVWSFLGVC